MDTFRLFPPQASTTSSEIDALLLPTTGTFGDVARGRFTGPGYWNLDMSLFKRFAVSSLRCGRVGKLLLDRRRDQTVIFKLDPIQMFVRLRRIADRKCGSPRH